ncbi:hypothetical protein BSL78_27167 [Apostichopus japonicus]|uniref:Leishmanolysin-like peptidase n=1 Tax=Stichopus japonicus TaxID=307972 RepID=A0A2G8JJS3_STIJA|nr:hypothetical protein BSL78_27167 [Apostichopus japonicus]
MLQWPNYKLLFCCVAMFMITVVISMSPEKESKLNGTTPTIDKYQYKCIFDDIQLTSQSTTTLNYRHPPSREKRSADHVYQPIRIKNVIGNLDPPMESEVIEKIHNVVGAATTIITKIFKVYPVQGPLILSRSATACSRQFLYGVNMNKCAATSFAYTGEECLDGFMIPDDHLEGLSLWTETGSEPSEVVFPNGVGLADTDIVLYLKAEHTVACNSKQIFAYAASCKLDQFNRPIAGLVNFCPNYLKEDVYDEKEFTLVALHEIFHILGFSQRLFDTFQVCSVCEEGLHCEDRGDIVYEDAAGQIRLHTPAVSLAAQKQWNCTDDSIGVPLENKNGGSSSSHWESQVMLGSLMAPVLSEPHLTFLDEITLSVFEDSGWYKVNYEYAEEYPWGKGQGCEFANSDYCLQDTEYFCNSSNSGCHYLHEDIATCASDEYLSGCSIFKSQKWCGAVNTTKETNATSMCYLSNLLPTTNGHSELRGQCYLTRCINNSSQYEIKVNNSQWILCIPGEPVTIPGYIGEVHCPPVNVICRDKTSILDILNTSPIDIPTSPLFSFTTQATEIQTIISIQFNFSAQDVDHDQVKVAFLSSICHLIPVNRSSVVISDTYLDQGIFQFTFLNLTTQEVMLHIDTLRSAVINQEFQLYYQNQSFTAYQFTILPHLWTEGIDASLYTTVPNTTRDIPQFTPSLLFAIVIIGCTLLTVLFALAVLALKMVKQQAMVAPLPTISMDVEVTCSPRVHVKEPRNAYQVPSRENTSTFI